MIALRGVTKTYRLNGRAKCMAARITTTFPTGASVAILGRNGAGKSSLLRMIAGTMRPDSGRIITTGRLSWPVGFAGSFHPDLTGAQNTRFLARVYGVDTDALCAFVADFAELGAHFALPVRSYSSGMRSRLAFGISMGIPFDTYLIDEITAVGDAGFRQKSEALLAQRLAQSGAIIVSHAMGQVARLCRHGAVLENGQLTYYPEIGDAIRHHEALMEPAA